jgi:hypothetical protein
MAERNEAVEMDRGSRSALIVAPESRETDPRKPVSSQGGGARRGESLFSLIWIEISNKIFWELSGETTNEKCRTRHFVRFVQARRQSGDTSDPEAASVRILDGPPVDHP